MKHILFVGVFLFSFQGLLTAQNAGEIIFSKSAINPQQPGSTLTSFQAGDPIYSIAYLPRTLQELCNAQTASKLEIEVFIYEIKPPQYSYQQPSEEELTFASMWVLGNAMKNKYLVVDIAPDPSQTSAYGNPEFMFKEFGKKFDGPVNYAASLSNLQSGEHIMKIIVKCNYQAEASGTFKLSGSDFSMYKTLSENLNLAAHNAGAKNAMMPKAKMTDAALQTRMISAFKNSNDWKNGRFDATETTRIVILDSDWSIRRHEISGAILHRYIRAAIAVKTRDGNCAYYDLVTFQEDYAGGKFQPLRYDGAGDKIMLDCANVLK
jgi:hypothetical protein